MTPEERIQVLRGQVVFYEAQAEDARMNLDHFQKRLHEAREALRQAEEKSA